MTAQKKPILLVATLDTKAEEAEYIKQIIEKTGQKLILADIGILDKPKTKADITRNEIAKAGGSSTEALAAQKDEGKASEIMGKGLAKIALDLYNKGKIAGIIAIGGSFGTATASTTMKTLPVGVPKVMVSTMASRDVRPYVGTSDVAMIYSVTDIFGLNRISRRVLANAAGAIVGMTSVEIPMTTKKPLVGVSLTGEQAIAATMIKKTLEKEGFEVVLFHAVGSGGKALEQLVKSKVIDGGVIDLATQELYSNLYDAGGMFDSGPDRLESAGDIGLPHIVVPGCADFMSFPAGQVPAKFKEHKMHAHNPALTVVKCEKDEVKRLAKTIGEKINKGKGPRAVIVPTQGFSRYDKQGHPAGFYDPAVREQFLIELRKNVQPSVQYQEVNAHVNDPEFAATVSKVFLELFNKQKKELTLRSI
jgi:uncharacterized protein (UPF0261 family)